jgi:hypothetical protein
VVEHSIGNGEVDSSILSGSTSFLNEIKKQERAAGIQRACYWHLQAEQSAKWRAEACKIRAVCSGDVLTQVSPDWLAKRSRAQDATGLYFGTIRRAARSRKTIAAESRMLTILAILAGPILVTTVLIIVFFEIKDVWDKNRLR